MDDISLAVTSMMLSFHWCHWFHWYLRHAHHCSSRHAILWCRCRLHYWLCRDAFYRHWLMPGHCHFWWILASRHWDYHCHLRISLMSLRLARLSSIFDICHSSVDASRLQYVTLMPLLIITLTMHFVIAIIIVITVTGYWPSMPNIVTTPFSAWLHPLRHQLRPPILLIPDAWILIVGLMIIALSRLSPIMHYAITHFRHVNIGHARWSEWPSPPRGLPYLRHYYLRHYLLFTPPFVIISFLHFRHYAMLLSSFNFFTRHLHYFLPFLVIGLLIVSSMSSLRHYHFPISMVIDIIADFHAMPLSLLGFSHWLPFNICHLSILIFIISFICHY